MNMNMKNARRLERRMQEASMEIMHVDIISGLTVSVYDEIDIRTAISARNTKNEELLQDAISLKKGAFIIRAKIRDKNFSTGIDDLIVRQLAVCTQKEILSNYLPSIPMVDADITRIENKMADFSSDVNMNDEFRINNIISADKFKEINTEISRLGRELEQIKDQCASMNITNTIDIPDYIDELVNKYNLI